VADQLPCDPERNEVVVPGAREVVVWDEQIQHASNHKSDQQVAGDRGPPQHAADDQGGSDAGDELLKWRYQQHGDPPALRNFLRLNS